MDLRRETKKRGRALGMAVTVAALTASVLLALFIPADQESNNVSSVEGADDRATFAAQGITAMFEKENSADEFSYEIKETLSFEDGDSEAKLLLKNPSVNHYLMYLEIHADDKTVLKTGNLAPGQIIKEIKLDEKLSKGEYEAIAYIYAVDPESYKTVGVVTQPITIKIKK